MADIVEAGFARLSDAQRHMEELQPIAESLMAADPKLPLWSAITIAGDRASKAQATARFLAGEAWLLCAEVLVGSYARMEWVLEQMEAGRIDENEVWRALPGLWRGSDPDDTDKRFLRLWVDAWIANGQKYLRDGKALPRKSILTVYRGQDEDAMAGIAWSLSLEVARKFANGAATRQWNRDGIVYEARVRRRDVLAYLTGRNEEEVIVNPMDLLVDE